MGRLLGFVMMGVALWAGAVVYSEGVEGLTGRAEGLVQSGETELAEPAEPRSLPRRFGDAVSGEMAKREQQMEDRLDHLEDL